MATQSNNSNPKKGASTPVQRTLDPATAADVDVAAALIPNGGNPIGRPLSSTSVSALSNPALQKKILGVASQLAVFHGCDDLQGTFDTANEAKDLLGVYDRFVNSAGRVRQRYVQINKRIIAAEVALVAARDAAAPGSDVAKALAGLAGLRKAEVSKAKGKKTATRNRKKKAAQAGTPSKTA